MHRRLVDRRVEEGIEGVGGAPRIQRLAPLGLDRRALFGDPVMAPKVFFQLLPELLQVREQPPRIYHRPAPIIVCCTQGREDSRRPSRADDQFNGADPSI